MGGTLLNRRRHTVTGAAVPSCSAQHHSCWTLRQGVLAHNGNPTCALSCSQPAVPTCRYVHSGGLQLLLSAAGIVPPGRHGAVAGKAWVGRQVRGSKKLVKQHGGDQSQADQAWLGLLGHHAFT